MGFLIRRGSWNGGSCCILLISKEPSMKSKQYNNLWGDRQTAHPNACCICDRLPFSKQCTAKVTQTPPRVIEKVVPDVERPAWKNLNSQVAKRYSMTQNPWDRGNHRSIASYSALIQWNTTTTWVSVHVTWAFDPLKVCFHLSWTFQSKYKQHEHSAISIPLHTNVLYFSNVLIYSMQWSETFSLKRNSPEVYHHS